jgi:two-component system KDP operon response regulator KdpE
MSSEPRVLIVEDDPAIRRLLRGALMRAGHGVIEAASAREAMAAVDIDKPDAVLLDLGLPDRDGLELIQLVKARGDAVLLVVSARVDTAEKVAALDLGADDYLTKPFDTEEVLARIRTALRHRRTGTAERTTVAAGAVLIDLAHRRVVRDGATVHVTPKEYQVLSALAQFPDRVIGHAQLLRTIWGPAQEHHVEYLRIVVRGLRQKLEDDPATPRLIVNVPGVGYRLTVDRAPELPRGSRVC